MQLKKIIEIIKYLWKHRGLIKYGVYKNPVVYFNFDKHLFIFGHDKVILRILIKDNLPFPDQICSMAPKHFGSIIKIISQKPFKNSSFCSAEDTLSRFFMTALKSKEPVFFTRTFLNKAGNCFRARFIDFLSETLTCSDWTRML